MLKTIIQLTGPAIIITGADNSEIGRIHVDDASAVGIVEQLLPYGPVATDPKIVELCSILAAQHEAAAFERDGDTAQAQDRRRNAPGPMRDDVDMVAILAERFIAEGAFEDLPSAEQHDFREALARVQAAGRTGHAPWLSELLRIRSDWQARQAAGEMNETRDEEEADTVVEVLDDLVRAVAGGATPDLSLGPVSLGDIEEAVSYADSFVTDWADNEGAEDPDCHKACAVVERLQLGIPALAVLMHQTTRAIGNARGALGSTLHQIGQMSGMFDDEDGTIADAEEAAEESRQELDDIEHELLSFAGAVKPVRVVVDVTGGIVQSAAADDDTVQLIVIDYDTDTVDQDRVVEVPQAAGRTERGTVEPTNVDVDPRWIDEVLAAKAKHEATEGQANG